MLVIPAERFTNYDISQPGIRAKVPEQHFDLTISSEVAEHIDPQDADNFMDITLWESKINGGGHRQGFKSNCRRIFWGLVDLVPSFIRAVKRRL